MFKKLLSIGVTKDLKGDRLFTVRMLNGIAISTILIILLYTFIHIYAKEDLTIMYSHALYVLTAVGILVANIQRRDDIAVYITNIFFPITFFVSGVFLGGSYQSEYLLFLTGIGTNFLFLKQNNIRISFLLYNVMLFIASKVYYIYYPNGIVTLNPDFIPLFSLMNGLITLFIIYSIVGTTFRYNSRLYEKLKELSENQEEIIQERTLELERSSEELKRFAFISAHDLREPLRNILGFSQMLNRNIQEKNHENIDEYVGYINKSVTRMDTITKDVVSYLGLENLINQVESIDTHEVVCKIAEDLIMLYDKKIELTITVLPTIKINRELCQLLFYNLLENAIVYCDKSIVRIKISHMMEDNRCLFSVQDNGQGINQAYFETIFEMFRRLENDIDRKGSGIGLSICKKIVNAYQGHIWVESMEGVGSTFHFTLANRGA